MESLDVFARSLAGRRTPERALAGVVLVAHCCLLAWAATRHSPTIDEPPHLAEGIAHLEYGRFDLYNVNPPLTRMIAAIPVVLAPHHEDWGHYARGGMRPEFRIGRDFMTANGERSFRLFIYARWACLPFTVLGALVCFRWASALYGPRGGLLALCLWCLGPNILARVVRCAARGYGNAVRWGVEAARGEMILMADGDGSYDLGSIAPLIAAMIEGAELVVGNRFQGGIQTGAMPWLNRRIGTPTLTVLTRLLYPVKVGDVNCGLRGFTRDAFAAMSLRAPGMEFASEMIARAALLGLKTVEVPTVLRPDGRGRRSHLRPWRDGLRHLWLLLALRLRARFRAYPRTGVVV